MYAKSELESGAPDGAYISKLNCCFSAPRSIMAQWHVAIESFFSSTFIEELVTGMITMITSPGGASHFSASSNSLGILQATTTRCISMWKSTPPMEQSGKLSKSTS